MSLPPGFLDELRNRISLSQVVGRKVVWDLRKSNQGKGDMWAPCPFHQEKSASFHVDDRKGFYYCFGCHAKGDALSFIKETENVGFMEAVEILAREAGMPMPARDPMAAQKADRRTQLVAVMEEAVKYFRLQLRSGAGAAARDYIAKRRLSVEGQDRFELGFAPDARQGLFQALTAKGIAPDLIVDAGLCIKPDEGGRDITPYDRFRGRIIFPIRDARGRAISLGGRAMDPNARAKYLNGPETELFDKGRSLYNIGPAREAAGKGQPLVVAEGYMDVIALSEAGFHATVAPLGTAVTEDQLRLMWRIHPEPVIALDGDAAGIRAALRVIDLALPLLEAGQGLRFAVLPTGQDPDDLIKAQGAAAMQRVLDAAQPMVNLLWQRETEGRDFDSPERKAALDKTLRAALTRIKDPSIRGHYGEEIKRLRWELFGQRGRKPTARAPFRPGQPRQAVALGPVANAKASLLASSRPDDTSLLASSREEALVLEAVLLATLVVHPALIHHFESVLEVVDLTSPDHDRLRSALLRHADAPDFRAKIDEDQRAVLETLFAQSHVQSAPPVRNAQDAELAAMCVAEGLAKLDARRGARREIEDAVEDLSGLADEGLTWRLSQASDAVNRAGKTNLEDASDMGEDRAALSQHLQNLIDGQVWLKKKG
ncbi:DNA primase [Fertoebacter nigrum]|uniref:DNA primase n=1 Tax=Fertoeibacter niger TaxID=2656921 RepID=A0A8X8GYG7_9RHOB|nr:DNA primase [Fertoeibacter niger]NUB44143.1 DNA primase [Fertoeibacter niger]